LGDGSAAAPVNVRLTLSLPRDNASVPMARRILSTTLTSAGVTEECCADILLALAEACANAVAHAQPADRYQVTVTLDQVECRIEVVDAGHGFDHQAARGMPLFAEHGRGLHIIEAVSDGFDLRPNDPNGTLISFVKRIA
jgi:serine/threonine-protein kinase RsbW